MSILQPNTAEIKRFLSTLWPGAKEGLLSIVAIKSGKVTPKFFQAGKIEAITSAVERLAVDHDVYHTIGLMKSRPATGRGSEADVICLPGLWLDIDCREGEHKGKNLPSKEEALAFIRDLPLKPSLIIFSGGGFHIYFLFREPLYIHGGDEREAVKEWSSRFQKAVISGAKQKGWKLDNTSDLCRLLRIPGTFNLKRDPVMVEMVEETDHRYDISDFVSFTESAAPATMPPPKVENYLGNKQLNEVNELNTIPDDLSDLPIALRKLIREGVAEGERSEAVFAVIVSLLKAGVSDTRIHGIFDSHPEGIGRKYFEKGSGRGKWLKDEINRAFNFIHVRAAREADEIGELEARQWQPWPILGQECLGGISGRFVALACRKSEADPAAVLVTFLCRFGVEVGVRPYIHIGDSVHHPRVFGVIVGASSKSRKGTSAKPVERLFKVDLLDAAYEPARMSPGPLSSGEGLIFAVRDEVTAWKVDKKTGLGEEIVVDPGVNDKRFFVLDEELGSALAATKREGNTLSTIIRSAWDSGNLEPLTKSNRIKATGAHIGIISHITLAELHRKLEETEAFSGFANRILWICARRQGVVPFPEPMPAKELSSLQRELKSIIERVRSFEEMSFDEGAKERWMEVYGDLSKDGSGLVGCVCDRAEAQVIRLSMIYSLLDQSAVIRPEHLESAVTMWRYCEESARFIFSGREINPHSGKILEILRESGEKSTTELYDAFGRNITKRQLEEALTELISQKKVVVETVKEEGQRGRPRNIFRAINSFTSFSSFIPNKKTESQDRSSDPAEVNDSDFHILDVEPPDWFAEEERAAIMSESST